VCSPCFADTQEVDDLAEVAADVDVLYQTRIQKERFTDMRVGGWAGWAADKLRVGWAGLKSECAVQLLLLNPHQGWPRNRTAHFVRLCPAAMTLKHVSARKQAFC
jgi:hypothetical protein